MNSITLQKVKPTIIWTQPSIHTHTHTQRGITCIHVSSIWRSGEFSGDETAGGKGWISFGTTTKSLPKTKIAPALFAVPVERGNLKC